MDLMSLLGLLLGVTAVVGGSILKGSGTEALVSGAAFMIVIVGTFAAIMVQTPAAVMKRGFAILPWLFRAPVMDAAELIRKVVDWSNVSRKQGLLGLEPLLKQEEDPFFRKGLQLLVDGNEPEAIREVLETELANREEYDMKAAKVFEGMGVYSPTLGIIGAVMGLMSVMQNLADPSRLGPGIAAAFVATIYGIALANLIYLPAAAKLKGIVQEQTRMRGMVVDGLVAIAQGENPRNIESRLAGYVV